MTFFILLGATCLGGLGWLGFREKLSIDKKTNYLIFGITVAAYLVFIGMNFYEVKPWFDYFVKIRTFPDWAPAFSSADPASFFECSLSYRLHLRGYLSVYGPCAILTLFSHSFPLIQLFLGGSIIGLAFYYIKNRKNGEGAFLFLLILFNPFLLVQFSMPNKEVFIILSLVSYLCYRLEKWKPLIIMSLVFAFFSRIEFLMIFIFFLLLSTRLEKTWRKYFLAGLIFITTVFYNFIPGMKDKTLEVSKFSSEAKFGFTALLSKLCEEYFLFPLAAIPRAFLNIFEKTKGYVFSGNEINDPIGFSIDVLSEWIFFVALILAVWRKRIFILEDDRVFLFWIFLISVVTVPFPVHRYILPSYVLLISLLLNPHYINRKSL